MPGPGVEVVGVDAGGAAVRLSGASHSTSYVKFPTLRQLTQSPGGIVVTLVPLAASTYRSSSRRLSFPPSRISTWWMRDSFPGGE